MAASNIATRRDSKLLERIAEGDSRALEELYLGYHPRLARFLWRVTPRYENVEEIINDTFLVVWQRARDFRGASQVSTWIIGIAYRIALKSVRQQEGPSRLQAAEIAAEQFVDPTPASEMQDWVARGMSLLPLEQRLTLELAYHMGHSLQEISVITDCPVGTVKARMFHAREKLRHYLPMLGGSAQPDQQTDVNTV
jgi:RNA polymerase sigma-70 factor, ECF subfamily